MYNSLILNLGCTLNLEASYKFLPFHVSCAGVFAITSLLGVSKSVFECLQWHRTHYLLNHNLNFLLSSLKKLYFNKVKSVSLPLQPIRFSSTPWENIENKFIFFSVNQSSKYLKRMLLYSFLSQTSALLMDLNMVALFSGPFSYWWTPLKMLLYTNIPDISTHRRKKYSVKSKSHFNKKLVSLRFNWSQFCCSC